MKTIKMYVSKLSFLLILAMIITACSKDKKVAKTLNGEWRITKITTGSTVQLDSLPTFIMNECKTNDNCLGTWKQKDGKTYDFTWIVEEKGKNFYWNIIEADSHVQDIHPNDISGDYTISEHSSSKFVIKSCDDCAGSPLDKNVTIEMTK